MSQRNVGRGESSNIARGSGKKKGTGGRGNTILQKKDAGGKGLRPGEWITSFGRGKVVRGLMCVQENGSPKTHKK